MSDTRFSEPLIDRLRHGRVLVLTGAGVSAESGLSTFRSADGLWEGRDPSEVATPEAFRRDRETVWRFYAERRVNAAGAEPNPGHLALAALETVRGDDFMLATQNVDGLHERAGNTRMVRLHGSLWRLRCTACGDERDDLRLDHPPLPRCSRCDGVLRPGVVWFGEPLPIDAMQRAVKAAEGADVCLVAGTSSMVYPAAGLPDVARAAGAWTVEINPERTAISDRVDERLEAASGTILPELVEALGLDETS